MNREEWLEHLVKRLAPLIDNVGEWAVPEKIKISVGFPSIRALSKRRVIGQCWYSPECEDKETTNILVSPVLSDPGKVAEVVLHEMIHAAVGPGHGHKGPFITLGKALGFTKPWTSTPATEELKEVLAAALSHLPPYPHSAIDATMAEKNGKPQGTRMVKIECVKCGYTLRTTRKWIEVGLPTCVCGGEIEQGEDNES